MPEPRPPVPRLATAVAARFGHLPGVAAVFLGGSRAAGVAGEGSDVDLYVYAEPEIPVARRAVIAGGNAVRSELDQRFWVPGDVWIDAATGLTDDVMDRSPAWIEDQLDRVLMRHEASVGYSTAIWHNVRTALPLVDRAGWFAALQACSSAPYPEPLRRAIVAKNHPLLRRSLLSFLHQIENALLRRDAVAVQHRLTALLASSFDILFALNRQTHPGEKRLVQHALARCPLLPPEMERRLHNVLALAPAAPKAARILVPAVHRLLDGLDALLDAEALRPKTEPRPS